MKKVGNTLVNIQVVYILVCLILVVSIRFNRNPLIIQKPLNDAFHYTQMVSYFRGQVSISTLRPPFNERFLTPLLSSFLPFQPQTAINIVNVLFLMLALYLIRLIARWHGLSELNVWLSNYLFVFSFPTFYYSTIGYVDAGVLAMVLCAWYGLLTEKWFIFISAFIIGVFIKEGIVIIVPVAFAWLWLNNYGSKAVLMLFFSLIVYISVWKLIKMYAPSPLATQPNLYWTPDLARFYFNFNRFTFWFSSLMSMGIPAILIGLNLKTLIKYFHHKVVITLLIGIFSGLSLWIYALFSAYVDGRFIWISSGFWIILALWLVQKRQEIEVNP